MDKTNLRRVAQRQSTVGLNSPSIFICCSFLWVKTELFKKPPTYNPGFSASCSFSTNKTFEGQLKQSKPFSYRRFSWLTLLYLHPQCPQRRFCNSSCYLLLRPSSGISSNFLCTHPYGWPFSLIPLTVHTAKCFLMLSYPITPTIILPLFYTVEPCIPCNDVFSKC